MQSEYRRADHFGPCYKSPSRRRAFRLTAYGQTTERSSWVCSLGFPRGSRLGPTTSSKANLERAVSCGSFPGMWSCGVAYATISCRWRSGRANPPTLLAEAAPARRGPEPRSIAPGNFIRRRLLIGSPGPVALPFGNLRPFSVPSAFFDVQQTDARDAIAVGALLRLGSKQPTLPPLAQICRAARSV